MLFAECFLKVFKRTSDAPLVEHISTFIHNNITFCDLFLNDFPNTEV